MDAATLGGCIVDAYEESNPPCTTLSAIDLTQMGSANTGLVGALETFADRMLKFATQDDWSAVRTARDNSRNYAGAGYIDLGDFAARVAAANVSASIKSAANAILTALDSAVIQAFSGNDIGNGLSIYIPSWGISGDYDNTLDFVADTQWEDFLEELIS
jgi:hypothetical protein